MHEKKTIAFYHNDIGKVIVRTLHTPYSYNLPIPSGRIKKRLYDHDSDSYNYITYEKDFMTFDIETTTICPEEYKLFQKGLIKHTDENPYSFMYIWQACLNEDVIIGRTWEDFIYFFDLIKERYNLSDTNRMVVYVHFLSYEMQFIQSFLNIYDLFAKDIRKPLKFMCDHGFEFRCSYFLSNMSLRKFCENSESCIHKKIKDEFVYDILRTPSTELTDLEYGYVYCDVKGLHECIEDRLKKDTLATIPMTSTGYVRRDMRKSMMKNKKNRDLFLDLRLDLHLYELLKDIFRGGDTHASRFYAGMILHGDIDSYDFKSSYPFIELTECFPMSKWYEYPYYEKGFKTVKYLYKDFFNKKKNDFEKTIQKYCVIAVYEFSNIRLKNDSCSTYIDIGHVRKYCNMRGDNGRVLAADYIEYPMTEIDFKIICDLYYFDEVIISDIWYAKKGKLPAELKDVVRKYFYKKTEYDGIEEMFYEYVKSKNNLNSTYGMMVSAIIHSYITCVNGNWKEKKPEEEEKVEQLNKYYDNKNSFLPYQWGIYVTAYARLRLHYLRNECEKINRDSPIYWDTDSLKFFHDDNFIEIINKYNKGVISLNESAVKPNGEKVYLGTFEREKGYKTFKTLGAKKYIVEKKDGTREITVAGLGKEKGLKYLENLALKKGKDIFELFSIGTVIEDSGNLNAFYNDNTARHYIYVNGEKILTGSNVAMLPSSYEIGVTKEYYEIIAKNL